MPGTIANITKNSDYAGLVQIKDSAEQSTYFDTIVFEIERDILRGDSNFVDGYGYGFLGDAVYIALIADLDSSNEPQTSPYINLINGVNYTNNAGVLTMFRGLKELLKLFVYSEFLKRDSQSSDGAGLITLKAENADVVEQRRMRHEAHIRWNKGVDFYNNEAYQYMINYQSSFPGWLFTEQSKFITNGIR